MQKGLISKGLVFGIILLFVESSVIPSISGNNKKYTESDMYIEENVGFVSGEFIVKFKAETIVDISKSPDGLIYTGLDSIDILNEQYNVAIIERLFNSYEKSPLYNVFKFSVSMESDILTIVHDKSALLSLWSVAPTAITSL